MKRALPHPLTTMLMVAMSCAALTACSSREYYLLGPEAGGSPGAMRIRSLDSQDPKAIFTLDEKHQVAMSDGQTPQASDKSADELRSRFTQALDAQPLPPTRFTLYFNEGTDTLTPDSQAQLGDVLKAVAQRPVPDLIVIGHTDRVGSVKDNDRLSNKRAQSLVQQFVSLGVSTENITAVGRGEREPLVVTDDEVAEPRNRRVEILVR